MRQDIKKVACPLFPMKKIILLLFIVSISLFAVPNPKANYQMDECSWNGTSGEVKDSSGNGYNGKSQIANTEVNSSVGGMLCHVGDFTHKSQSNSDDSDDDLVQLPKDVMNGLKDFTFTTWIKTNQSGKFTLLSAAKNGSNKDNEAWMLFLNGKKFNPYIKDKKASSSIKLDVNVSDGNWHHIAITRKSESGWWGLTGDSKVCITIDGDKNNKKCSTISNSDGKLNVDGLVLGQDQDKVLGDYNNTEEFNGYMDEVKIFSGVLSDTDIQDIYNNEKSRKNYDGSTRSCASCPPPPPIANYQMDECSWDGTSGEVEDSSGNNHNGTIEGTPNTESNQTAGGMLCRTGYFDNASSDSQAISVPDSDALSPHIGSNGEMTLSAWIKTDRYPSSNKQGRVPIVAKGDSGNWEYALYLYNSGKVGFSVWQASGSGYGEPAGGSLSKNEWHHLVGVVKKGSYVRIYLDGQMVKEETNLHGDTANGTSPLYIARRGSGNHYFHGYIDEVKIFDKALTDSQIQTVYNNEKDKKNYDGSQRVCGSCGCYVDTSSIAVTPLEFEGAEITLNKSGSSPHWTHVDFNKTFNSVPVVFILPEKRGSHPASVRIKNITTTGFDAVFAEPQGEDGPHLNQNINFLAINEGIHKIGNTYFQVSTISTKKIQQASQGSSVVNEWEKVDTIFSSCQPAVVGQIQSLNNESGLDIPNPNKIIRSKPWMTTAIDVNSSGVYMALERSETNEENISQDETIGYMIAPPNIQDSVVDDNGNNILFETIVKKNYFVGWDDSCKEVDFVNTYSNTPLVAANKNSKNEADGGWFRRCSLDNTKIGLQIDEDGSGSSKSKYNYQNPPQDKERNHIAETGAIFAFSGTIIIHEPPQNKSYKFDAWDTFRNINDRNISTKIVKQDFNLTIASLDENGANLQDFNGTVCTQISGDANWIKSDFRDQNTTTASYYIASAMKDTNVTIVWKKDVNESCPLSNEDNSTNSTDNFAIRPEKFEIYLPSSTLYAGKDFNISFSAKDGSDDNTTDYNETKNDSFTVDKNITKSTCNLGNFNMSGFSFANGQKNDVNASYSEVGDLNITIKEINGSEYAKVDADDTNETQRLIEQNSTILSFKPYQFSIINYTFSRNNPDANWRYMTDVNDSNISLSFNVQAQNEQNQTTQNFDAECAAENVGVKIDLNVTNDDANASYFERINNTETFGNDKNLSDINFNGTVNDNNFTDGVSSDIIYALNVYRVYNQVKDPRTIQVVEVNTTNTDVKNIGLSPENNSSKFYYARLYTQDLSTSKKSDTVKAKVLVYDSTADAYVKDLNLTEELSNWYHYTPQNDAANGNITALNVSNTTNKKPADYDNNIDANVTDFANATFTINVTNNQEHTQTRYIHLDINPWLWYVYKKFGTDYNSSNNSSCSAHPCIKYNYHREDNNESGVHSGSTSGVKFNANVSKNSRGIRLLR